MLHTAQQHDQPAVYLAGKVRRNCWRHDLVPGLRDAWSFYGAHPGRTLPPSWPVVTGKVEGRAFDYVGPYFASDDHGCTHVEGHHAATTDCSGDRYATRRWVHGQCLDAIRRADLVVAWIESPDAYGTLAELGYAAALGKRIRIGIEPKLAATVGEDMWFVRKFDADPPRGLEHGGPAAVVAEALRGGTR